MDQRTTVFAENNNTNQRKIDITITLDGGNDQVYTTNDNVSGRVTIEHEHAATITELALTLEGVSATHVDNASNTGPAAGKTRGRHHFLKLRHPVDDSLLHGYVVGDGRDHIHIPFNFVVPKKMLDGACNHKIAHEDVIAAHLLLPPALQEVHYAKLVQLANISYAIHVNLSLQATSTGVTQNGSRSFDIRIAPTRDEEPPLGVYDDEHEYCLCRTVPVKSTVRKVLGQLTAETSQPPCLQLNTVAAEGQAVTSTIKLTFVPAKQEESPPDITAIVAKFQEYTFYAAAPFEVLPRPSRSYAKMMLQRSYVEDFVLSTRKLTNVPWAKQVDTASTISSNDASNMIPSSTYFTTSIQVPVTIPKIQNSKGSKRFTPSFHSCLISRTHAVEFKIDIKNNSIITLKTPIQLVATDIRQQSTSSTLPAAMLVEVDRVFSFEANDDAPDYAETMPSAAGQRQAVRSSSRADELPDYAADPNLTTGQTRRAAVNRHSVSTTYEVPPQEWQNLWTGAKYVYGKAKALQQRRSSKS